MGQLLQVVSGFIAVAAAGLLAFRVWTAPPEVAAGPAIYTPVPGAVKPGKVSVTESPANGFILVVEAKPDGAALWVDGVEKGETPASLNFECKPTAKLKLTLKHPGYATIEHEVSCKKDVMLLIHARLEAQKKP